MPQQLSLFEEPKHESQDYPLFFALLPDEEATLQIAQLVERFRQSHGLTGALRPLHVTLCDLVPRETPQRTIEVASKVAASVAAAPFRVALNRMTRFGGKGGKDKRPLVLAGDDGVAGLGQFRQRLCMQLRLADLTKRPGSFTPHLTLLYDDPLPPDQDVPPIAWTAQDFVLVRSLVGQSKHEVLGRWPLSA
jgi:2'-5' RNA ligase